MGNTIQYIGKVFIAVPNGHAPIKGMKRQPLYSIHSGELGYLQKVTEKVV